MAGQEHLSGRNFTWHDDKNAPPVAVVNAEFAHKIFGSITSAIGGYYEMEDGTRIEVVGIVVPRQLGNFFGRIHGGHFAMFMHRDEFLQQLVERVRPLAITN
jgi:hypothetical protein